LNYKQQKKDLDGQEKCLGKDLMQLHKKHHLTAYQNEEQNEAMEKQLFT